MKQIELSRQEIETICDLARYRLKYLMRDMTDDTPASPEMVDLVRLMTKLIPRLLE